MTTLKIGVLLYNDGDKTLAVAVKNGYAQVDTNVISVLTDEAQVSTEIEVEATHRLNTEITEDTSEWNLALQEAIKYQ